jgi:hypothetical protein
MLLSMLQTLLLRMLPRVITTLLLHPVLTAALTALRSQC